MLVLLWLSDGLTGAFLVLFQIVTRGNAVVAILLTRQTVVPLRDDPLMLLVQHVWLEAEHPRHAHQRDQKQHDLDEALARVELRLRIDSAGGEEHVDEHVEETGRGGRGLGPVDRPLVDDADDEVTKDAPHEEDLGDELGVDVEVLLKVQVVRDLEADRKRHLGISRWPGKGTLTWMTPRMMDIFILYELVKMSALSEPCQLGSRPNG
jgi:hypothetical protein